MLNLNCVICAELFSPSDDVYVTSCGHMFHYLCLSQWLERSKSCPQCRCKCTDRNIFRVYFNLANLDTSRIDVGSLQEQLDNVNLQMKLKEKDLNKAQEQVKSLKEVQKKCMKTIDALEQKLQKNDFLILSYKTKLEMAKSEVRIMDDLRKEVKSLKNQIETMEGVSTLLTCSFADAEKLLKIENDPRTLSIWVSTLKRELRISESKKIDMRNVLKVVQNDLRKEIELKRMHEERISQLESENYQLSEKIKTLETASRTPSVVPVSNSSTGSTNALLSPLGQEEKRLSISPTIKETIKKIEESDSPYLNIKSCSVGLAPLLKRNHTRQTKTELGTKPTTTKVATLRVSPPESNNNAVGVVRKTASDLTEKYSIFKKPRIGLVAGPTGSAGSTNDLLVFNGFGGSERADPFQHDSNEEAEEITNTARKIAISGTTTTSKVNTLSINNRLKAGGLRNFKISK